MLGEGGFGIVYLVYSHQTKEVYAFKTFRDEYLKDITTRERFRKEAQVWIDLERHPYLARAYFVDEISGRLYIAMEYIASNEPGMNTLEGYLRRRPPDLTQSLKWAIQFCHGMEYAYSKGVKAHRDIKPANIMIDQNKIVKITDFGLAGVLSTSSVIEQDSFAGEIRNDSSMQTVLGTSIGTPEYMSPEQFTDFSACDERSDIYSFGIVLYQMASGGSLPFSSDNPQHRWAALKHLHNEAPVPKLNSSLFPIVWRCLQKEPKIRYQSFKELRGELEIVFEQRTGEVFKLPEQKELEAWELLNKGVSLVNLIKEKEAIFYYDKAIEINPGYAVAWCNKGQALKRLGRYEEAIACIDRALELNPRDEKAWNNRGASLYSMQKYEEMIICIDRALEINPINAKAWSNKGAVLAKLDKPQEAIACYDRSLQLNPREAEIWHNKGAALGSLSKHHEAVVCYNKALEINPRLTESWTNKGHSLMDIGNKEEALYCYDNALEINQNQADAWLGKAFVTDNTDKSTDAIVAYSRFIELAQMQHAEIVKYARQRLKELKCQEVTMICDVCNSKVTGSDSKRIPPEKFRQLLDRGFDIHEDNVKMLTDVGIPRSQAIEMLTQQYQSSQSDWLLCTNCFVKAEIILKSCL